eukprot:c581_g1_i1.p2 GENE.c581_g1_i1~~c581_g1_i1.p2  ORF type:complete len:124 (-),score=15.50 c581_g1_i1:55-426(-)
MGRVTTPTMDVRQFTLQQSDQARLHGQGHEICSICIDELKTGERAIQVNVCSHVYHEACLSGWFAQNNVCPNCRRDVAVVPAQPLCRGCGRPFNRPPYAKQMTAQYYRCSDCYGFNAMSCAMM